MGKISLLLFLKAVYECSQYNNFVKKKTRRVNCFVFNVDFVLVWDHFSGIQKGQLCSACLGLDFSTSSGPPESWHASHCGLGQSHPAHLTWLHCSSLVTVFPPSALTSFHSFLCSYHSILLLFLLVFLIMKLIHAYEKSVNSLCSTQEKRKPFLRFYCLGNLAM